MKTFLRTTLWIALVSGLSPVALAQRAIHTKDAPAPVSDTPDDDDAIPSPNASSSSSSSKGTTKRAGKNAAPDAGPYVKPTLSDDVTDADVKRANAAPAAVDCGTHPCERIYRRHNTRREMVLHLRPAQPRLGETAEVVLEVSEILEEADPETGDKKPMEGQTVVAHIDGLGKFAMVPLAASAGSYGFHFTPQAKGTRRLTIEGAGQGSEDFDLPIGEPPSSGSSASTEIRIYEPRPSLDATGQEMAALGQAWGGLWSIALGTGRGDQQALTRAVQKLAKVTATHPSASASGASRTTYIDFAHGLVDATSHLTGESGAKLKGTLQAITDQQCNKCHAAYAWGLTEDVSEWPSFKVTGQKGGDGE